MKVSELMITDVFTCKETDQLVDVARLMWEHDIGFVPVIGSANGSPVGVITDRDGFMAAYFQGKPLGDIKVKSAMSPFLASIAPDATVGEAEGLMCELQLHRLPVVTKEGKLVGVISINDLARAAARESDAEFEEEVAVTMGAICQPRTP